MPICILCIGTIMYAAPFVYSRAASVPGSTQLARLGTVYLGKHAASPQHPQVVTLAASPRPPSMQESGLSTRWSFGWPYGGRQNACIISSNILIFASPHSTRPSTDPLCFGSIRWCVWSVRPSSPLRLPDLKCLLCYVKSSNTN